MRKHRYQHILQGFKGTRQPARIMSVAANEKLEGSLSLVQWSLCWFRCEHGRVQSHKQVTSEGRHAFWELVTDLMSSEGEAWMFSFQAKATMELLGMWERIEEGTLRTQDRSTEKMTTREFTGMPIVSDFMIIHDPPFMVRVAIPGRPGRFVVVDLRNYGISDEEKVSGTAGQALRNGASAASLLHSLASANGPTLQATAASTAHAWYRMQHMRQTVLVHTHKDSLLLERNAMHGGRCECFHIGLCPERHAHLDVRSAYPAVCMTTALPARLLHYGEGCEPLKYTDRRGPIGVIADATFHVTRPVLPYVKDGLTVYPIGRFRSVVCGPELALAQTCGHVLKWHKWATYELDPILADFQNALWLHRQDALRRGDKGADDFYKRLMNAVVGKFAQRGRFWENAPDVTAHLPYGTWYRPMPGNTFECCRAVAWNAQRLIDRGESADSCPAIAAWVYSEARVRLWRLIEKAGRENVAYVDTDSLFVNACGGRRLAANPEIPHGEIGGLRDVDGFDVLTLRGIKDYSHGDKRVKAGEKPSPHDSHVAEKMAARSAQKGAYRHGIVCEGGFVQPWSIWE